MLIPISLFISKHTIFVDVVSLPLDLSILLSPPFSLSNTQKNRITPEQQLFPPLKKEYGIRTSIGAIRIGTTGGVLGLGTPGCGVEFSSIKTMFDLLEFDYM